LSAKRLDRVALVGAIAVVVLHVQSTMTHATSEGSCTVQQPIVFHDAGIVACPVTFACRGSLWDSPGCLVAATIRESEIWTELGFENRNAASLAGVRLELVPHPEPVSRDQLRGLFGDTLRVVLDVSDDGSAEQDSEVAAGFGWPLRDVLGVTRICMLANAALEPRRIRFLEIRIRGARELSDLEGIFAVRGS
jgi:hypothetical protein